MEYTTPSGFRDVLADEAREREALARRVLDLLDKNGYAPIETPTLERLDVMEEGGRVPATPFKFLDATGQLVTLRPDVTLQVARMAATRLQQTESPIRLRYIQRVFRESGGQLRADVREKKQIGIECIGLDGPEADAEILRLFVQSLEAAGVGTFTISLANVGVLRSLLAASGAPVSWVNSVLEAFHASSYVELDRLCGEAEAEAKGETQAEAEVEAEAEPASASATAPATAPAPEPCATPADDASSPNANGFASYARAIQKLARISGGPEAIEKVRELVEPLGCAEALDGFQQTLDLLSAEGLADKILIDFSVMSSFDYYTGMVFEAYAPGVGEAIGSGGRYNVLLNAYGAARPAAGFAFYVEGAMAAREAERSESDETAGETGSGSALGFAYEKPLRIAVPKGSLNADTIEVLAAAGLDVSGLAEPGRALIIRNPGVEYIIVRPSDAPIFVEMGAADCGICGEDSLLECDADVVELSDLRFGACRFIVAQLNGAADAVRDHYARLGSLRVATKYPRIAQAHFARRGVQVEIVELRGNIELGPLTGMSECIVDITATGTTLRENNLVITDEVLSSTARFFANKASFRTDGRIRRLARALNERVRNRDLKVTAGGAGGAGGAVT